MKMVRVVFLVLALVVMPAIVQAQFLFTTNNGAITITGYSGSDSNVVIPGAINGYPVTSIGNSAFYNSIVTNVSLPSTITNIGYQAFTTSSLTSMIIPDSVITIGPSSFLDCSNLASVTIGTNVTTFGDEAFGNCPRLTNIFIPASVTNFTDGSAFLECTNLIAIYVDSQNPVYSSVAGVLFDKHQTTLVTYPGGLVGSYVFPNTVTSIGDFAFAFNYNLTNVIIPEGITNVGQYAFSSCFNITNFTISGTVTTLGQYSFSGCTKVTTITIPEGVTSIGRDAFSDMGLTNIFIPASATNVGPAAFGCFTLKSINVDSSNPAYRSVDGVLFDVQGRTLVEFPIAKAGNSYNLGSYTVPQGTTAIGDSAFQGAYLANVTLPSTLTSIGNTAFDTTRVSSLVIPPNVVFFGWLGNCPKLGSIYFEGNAPVSGTGIPVITVGLQSITAYYLPGTTGWGPTFQTSRIPTALWSPPHVDSMGQNFGVQSNAFGFTINWVAGTTVVIEACDDLAAANWQPLQTNTLATGAAYFSDPQGINSSSRFYRVRTP